jgi:hypothetical protein
MIDYNVLAEVPLPYLFAAASLAFAGISLGFAAILVGILKFDELRLTQTPANKLTVSIPKIAFEYARDQQKDSGKSNDNRETQQ